jgi:hypothetical protein
MALAVLPSRVGAMPLPRTAWPSGPIMCAVWLKNNAVESAPRASGEMGTNRLQECGAIG